MIYGVSESLDQEDMDRDPYKELVGFKGAGLGLLDLMFRIWDLGLLIKVQDLGLIASKTLGRRGSGPLGCRLKV